MSETSVGLTVVTVLLPNNYKIINTEVLVCDMEDDCILGMDIICNGDLSIANANNETLFSFVTPPLPNKVNLASFAAEANSLLK
jgi:hypothetical protein